MLDFFNIALRTIMCLAFIAFVVRPMLMSMVRREPNTLELEEMAQLAVNSAFREQFLSFYAKLGDDDFGTCTAKGRQGAAPAKAQGRCAPPSRC